jgi:hypothetical protein
MQLAEAIFEGLGLGLLCLQEILENNVDYP